MLSWSAVVSYNDRVKWRRSPCVYERRCGPLLCHTSLAFSFRNSVHPMRDKFVKQNGISFGVTRTTVMGIWGAFGNMNATSSNLPLRRQF